jgi:hypothetical protein
MMMNLRRDRVAESQVLLDAEALGAALQRPVEDRDGRRAVSLDLAAQHRFTFVLTDLRASDQVVMVYRMSGGTVSPTLGIELATRTEALDRPSGEPLT